MTFRELLAPESLSVDQLRLLEAHYELLVRWNAKLNLTRIRDLQDVVDFHYRESLFAARSLPAGPLRIADIGSGAGFPGVPIAVSRPDCTIDLVESDQRKAVFLRESTRSLRNAAVVATRAESLPPSYDWIVSRAVRPLDVLRLVSAPNFALLLTDSELVDLPEPASVMRVPWGDHRVLAMFHVKHDKI